MFMQRFELSEERKQLLPPVAIEITHSQKISRQRILLRVMRLLADWSNWQPLTVPNPEASDDPGVLPAHARRNNKNTRLFWLSRMFEDVREKEQALKQAYRDEEQAHVALKKQSAEYSNLCSKTTGQAVGIVVGYLSCLAFGCLAGFTVFLPTVIGVVSVVSFGVVVFAFTALLFRYLIGHELINKYEKNSYHKRTLNNSKLARESLCSFEKDGLEVPENLKNLIPKKRDEAHQRWRLFQQRECHLAKRVLKNYRRCAPHLKGGWSTALRLSYP